MKPVKIDESTIVNDVIRDVPNALEVLRRHGIDSCCGGQLTVGEAARGSGIDPYRLVSELRRKAQHAEAAA